MSRPSINAAYSRAMNHINVINRYLIKSKSLPTDLQGFVAEILMLRLFSVLENCVKDVSVRIACGAAYRNGVPPHPIILCTSISDAEVKFRSGSKKSIQFSNVHHINESIKHVIDDTEPLRIKLSKYGNVFEEMRKVRNHIAHRTNSTLSKYKEVILSRYGANLRIKPGSFLVSTKRETRAVIDDYSQTIKIIIEDITNG